MGIRNVVDILLKLEITFSILYKYYAEVFPDDKAFWSQLSKEEEGHANFLKNYSDFLPIEFQKMNKKILIQIEEEIRNNLKNYQVFPPTIEDALDYAYLIEQSAGEEHYQALLESSASSERTKVFQVLNFGDRDHAKRINDYRIKKLEDNK